MTGRVANWDVCLWLLKGADSTATSKNLASDLLSVALLRTLAKVMNVPRWFCLNGADYNDGSCITATWEDLFWMALVRLVEVSLRGSICTALVAGVEVVVNPNEATPPTLPHFPSRLTISTSLVYV